MDAIEPGFRGFVDALAGASPDGSARFRSATRDEPDAPVPNFSRMIRARLLRMLTPSARYPLRGHASVEFVHLGLTVVDVVISRGVDGIQKAEFPRRSSIDGRRFELVKLSSTAARCAFSAAVWRQLVVAHPELRAPLGETQTGART